LYFNSLGALVSSAIIFINEKTARSAICETFLILRRVTYVLPLLSDKNTYFCLNFQTNKNASPIFLLAEPQHLLTTPCTISATSLTKFITPV
jgi:hypothetical protein